MSFYKTMRFMFKPFYKFWFNPTIINAENLNVEGPMIIACNHKCKLDPAASVISTKRIIHYMVKDKYYEQPVLGNFFKWMGCINVKTKEKSMSSIKSAMKVFPVGFLPCKYIKIITHNGYPIPDSEHIKCFGYHPQYIENNHGKDMVEVYFDNTENIIYGKNEKRPEKHTSRTENSK